MRIDHLGIAVRDLEAACRFYRMLGFEVSGHEEVPHEKVRVAMLPAGESRVELLEPTAPDSPVARFIEKRGEGLHHYAIGLADLRGTVAKLKAAGVRLVKDEVQIGAGGHEYVFVHPTAAGGVLLELIQEAVKS